jgi:hypothetical protein
MAFEKGRSGNPNGRPKRAKLFETALMLELKEAGEDMPALRKIAKNLISLCQQEMKDALPAIKEFADRIDGKVPQAVIGGDEDDNPVNVLHTIRRVIEPVPDR